MKNVIITGATGMVGGLALGYCLDHPEVGKVTTVVRKPTNRSHPKLVEVVHDNFLDFNSIGDHLKNQDVCLFCIGVYTGTVPRDEFRVITVDYTKAFAEVLKTNSPNATVCFLSGMGADQSGKSKLMFAQDKGIAENLLIKLQFKAIHIFRPGYIYPVVKRREPNFMYRVMRFLYKPILSKIYPDIGVSSEQLARAMVHVGFNGHDKVILENRDIRRLDV